MALQGVFPGKLLLFFPRFLVAQPEISVGFRDLGLHLFGCTGFIPLSYLPESFVVGTARSRDTSQLEEPYLRRNSRAESLLAMACMQSYSRVGRRCKAAEDIYMNFSALWVILCMHIVFAGGPHDA